MSFAQVYRERYVAVIEPAIESVTVDGVRLNPHRVDISQSGDSILTSIVDGIAHARLVLADVSTVGNDSKTGARYRNGNGMYEVGIALACRHPHEVLLVRDDNDPFLFDVSAIPHMTLDFTAADAVTKLAAALQGRLAEQQLMHDARIALAVQALTNAEAGLLRSLQAVPDGQAMSFNLGGLQAHYQLGLARLLDKGLIRPVDRIKNNPAYILTPFGRAAVQAAAHLLPEDPPTKRPPESDLSSEGQG